MVVAIPEVDAAGPADAEERHAQNFANSLRERLLAGARGRSKRLGVPAHEKNQRSIARIYGQSQMNEQSAL